MSHLPYIEQRIIQAAMRLFAERGGTQVSISELALAAGVARGTIYNHIGSLEHLFETVVVHLTQEMNQLIADAVASSTDPAERLARGIRLYARRSHDEPAWGLFIMSFAFSASQMHQLWAGQPAQNLQDGIEQGRFQLAPDQIPGALALMGSAVIAGMHLTRSGIRTWREAGSDSAALVLRAFGVPPLEAEAIAREHMLPRLETSQRLTG